MDYQSNSLVVEDTQPDVATANRRSDWRTIHYQIQKAIIAYTRQYQKFPSYREISRLSGYPLITVFRHMQESSTTMIHDYSRQVLTMLSDQVTLALLNAGLSGNMQALRVLFKIIFEYDFNAPVTQLPHSRTAQESVNSTDTDDNESTEDTYQDLLELARQRQSLRNEQTLFTRL